MPTSEHLVVDFLISGSQLTNIPGSAEHAPRGWRAFISYVQGWITIVGWIAALASLNFLLGSMITGVAILHHDTYTPQRWHVTIMMIGYQLLVTFGNIFGKTLVPLLETFGGGLHVLFFFMTWIALLATSDKTSGNEVWATFINAGGWSNDGVSFCIGFLTPAFALAGVDAVVHISEEAHNAPLNIPRAMIGAVLFNGVAGFAYVIAVLYAITNPDAVFGTPTGFPIVGVFLQATNSKAAATAMISGIIAIFGIALFGVTASISRLIWAFGRDGGLPASKFFAKVSDHNKSPNNAILFTFICVSLLSLINIGSTVAFNALVSLATLGFYVSYAIPIVLFTIRRFSRENPIDFGPWTIGKIGLPVNVLAVVFCAFLTIFLPFPPFLPVTRENMNYAAPVFVGVMLLAVTNYALRARHTFMGPITETPAMVSKTSENKARPDHHHRTMPTKTAFSAIAAQISAQS
jgi:choline transport protein